MNNRQLMSIRRNHVINYPKLGRHPKNTPRAILLQASAEATKGRSGGRGEQQPTGKTDRLEAEASDAAITSPSTPMGRSIAKARAHVPSMSPQRKFPLQLAAAAAEVEQLANMDGADGADGGGRRDAGGDEVTCGRREEPVGTDAWSAATVDCCCSSYGSSVTRVASGSTWRTQRRVVDQDGAAMCRMVIGARTVIGAAAPEDAGADRVEEEVQGDGGSGLPTRQSGYVAMPGGALSGGLKALQVVRGQAGQMEMAGGGHCGSQRGAAREVVEAAAADAWLLVGGGGRSGGRAGRGGRGRGGGRRGRGGIDGCGLWLELEMTRLAAARRLCRRR